MSAGSRLSPGSAAPGSARLRSPPASTPGRRSGRTSASRSTRTGSPGRARCGRSCGARSGANSARPCSRHQGSALRWWRSHSCRPGSPRTSWSRPRRCASTCRRGVDGEVVGVSLTRRRSLSAAQAKTPSRRSVKADLSKEAPSQFKSNPTAAAAETAPTTITKSACADYLQPAQAGFAGVAITSVARRNKTIVNLLPQLGQHSAISNLNDRNLWGLSPHKFLSFFFFAPPEHDHQHRGKQNHRQDAAVNPSINSPMMIPARMVIMPVKIPLSQKHSPTNVPASSTAICAAAERIRRWASAANSDSTEGSTAIRLRRGCSS